MDPENDPSSPAKFIPFAGAITDTVRFFADTNDLACGVFPRGMPCWIISHQSGRQLIELTVLSYRVGSEYHLAFIPGFEFTTDSKNVLAPKQVEQKDFSMREIVVNNQLDRETLNERLGVEWQKVYYKNIHAKI